MLLTYKYRLYPTKKQEEILLKTLELCKELYNSAIFERIDAYKKLKKYISYREQQNQLPLVKKVRPDVKEVYSQVLQDVLKRVDNAFKAFFGRIRKKQKPGFPKFKRFYSSFTYPQNGFRLDTQSKKLHLSKIGDIKIKISRLPEGKIKTCSIVKDKNHWFACITCEVKEKPKIETKENNLNINIGSGDVGLKSLITLHTGEKIENPKYLTKTEKKLKRLQKSLSRKKLYSKNWLKVKRKIQTLYTKIKNQRNDFLHKVSRFIVNTYSIFFFERLNIQGMVKNNNLSKSIQDSSWKKLCQYIEYKAKKEGKLALPVCSRNSSQECSQCGYIKQGEERLKLKDRIYKCSKCGLVIDRDWNSALVILKRGLEEYRGVAGNLEGTESLWRWEVAGETQCLSVKQEVYFDTTKIF